MLIIQMTIYISICQNFMSIKNICITTDIIFIGHVNKLFSYLICKHICKRQYVHLVQSNTQI